MKNMKLAAIVMAVGMHFSGIASAANTHLGIPLSHFVTIEALIGASKGFQHTFYQVMPDGTKTAFGAFPEAIVSDTNLVITDIRVECVGGQPLTQVRVMFGVPNAQNNAGWTVLWSNVVNSESASRSENFTSGLVVGPLTKLLALGNKVNGSPEESTACTLTLRGYLTGGNADSL